MDSGATGALAAPPRLRSEFTDRGVPEDGPADGRWSRSGVTLLPEPSPRAEVSAPESDGTAPPSAIAARETALAAAKAILRPRHGEPERSSGRATSWIRKPRPGSPPPRTAAWAPPGT